MNEPAFPCSAARDDMGKHETSWGMTLRDYFAAKAMQAMLSNPEACRQLIVAIEERVAEGEERRRAMHAVIAKRAYFQADAMLEAREPSEEKGGGE